MRVSDLGEFGLIERLAATVSADLPEALVVGIGDDAAVWRAAEGFLLATTDTLVEGVHFRREWASWQDLGWKALAVSVSDLAAMGGEPQFALVTLALPVDTEVGDIDEFYKGLRKCGAEYGVSVVGGDVVEAPQVAVTVALVGRAQIGDDGQPLLLRRDAARFGHVIAVTGWLGDSAAGLRRLRDGIPADDPLAAVHLQPRPPLQTAHVAARLGVPCGIDVSDGLLQDLGHVCRISGLTADLRADALPLSPELRAAFPQESLALACGGGEDYQMVFVGPSGVVRSLADSTEDTLTVIGEMREGPGWTPRLLDAAGNELSPVPSGWDHLRDR